MADPTLSSRIVEAAAGADLDDAVVLQNFDYESEKQNQLIFFFKPEVFTLPERKYRQALIELVLHRFAQFEMDIAGCLLVPGASLERSGAMDRHYGTINQLSRSVSSLLGEAELRALRETLQAPSQTPVLGGHEYLAARRDLDASALDRIWQEVPAQRIRSGFYVQLRDFIGGPVILVNGFHPKQLEHYTGKARRIAILLLNCDLPWRVLRKSMIGDTYPERALVGSLRRDFFEKATDFGIKSVDISNNCVHLSAGPYEALFEMSNFLSSVGAARFESGSTRLGRAITDRYTCEYVRIALENPECRFGKLFDLTEDVDLQSAVVLLGAFYSRIG